MPDFPITSSTDSINFSTFVGCSRKIAEQLRLASLDGLLALPRVGMGTGGYLVGTFEKGRIQIERFLEIPCAHSDGPSFALTSDEIIVAKELPDVASPMQVVGLYCSKTRGPSVLSEPVAGLFRTLCPEAWQVLLLLRPSTVEPSRAVIFSRDASGAVVKGAELDLAELDLAELNLDDNALPEPESVAQDQPELMPQPQLPPPEAEPKLTPAPMPAYSPAPLPPSRAVKPLFASAEPAFQRRWVPWTLAAAVLSGGIAAGWVTRDAWLPRPDLTLAATDFNGHLSIRWNRDAVRGLTEGMLSVNDGGDLHSYQLDRNLLENGIMGYERKSSRVNMTLRVGDRRVIASFFDPAPPPPPATEPPSTIPPPKSTPQKAMPRKAQVRKVSARKK